MIKNANHHVSQSWQGSDGFLMSENKHSQHSIVCAKFVYFNLLGHIY